MYWTFDTNDMFLASTLVWYQIHRQTHTGHIGTASYVHTAVNSITLNEQLADKKFNLLRSKMSLSFKYFLLVEVIYLLIRFNKTKAFLWNTKNANINGVYKKTKHTTHRKKDKLVFVSDIPYFKTTSYFTNPSLFMEKFGTPLFWRKFLKLNSPPPLFPLYIGEWGDHLDLTAWFW